MVRLVPKCAFCFFAAIVLLPTLTACFCSSEDCLREFDPSGSLLREEIRSESPVKSVLNSVHGKTVILWDNSWIAFITASSFSLEDPAPVFKMGIGHADKGYISLLEHHDLSSIPDTIRTIREEALSLSPSGVGMHHPGSAQALEDSK